MNIAMIQNKDTGFFRTGGAIMTISERIFERMNDLSMSQKEFSEATGIIPSTISEWKKKKTKHLKKKN